MTLTNQVLASMLSVGNEALSIAIGFFFSVKREAKKIAIMVIPFSNTKLRVPKGFQSLLVGLSTEVLRSQPRNIHEFAADYFEKLVQRRDQGESYLPDKQTSLEDRYYNNPSFQEEYSVNDPEVHNAATRIQAKFRGHKARQDVDKMKQDKDKIDTDHEELGVRREQSATPRENDHQTHDDDHHTSSHVASTQSDKHHEKRVSSPPSEKHQEKHVANPPSDKHQEKRVASPPSDKHQEKHVTNPPSDKHEQKNGSHASPVKKEEDPYKIEKEPDQPFSEVITDEEKQEQERAARSIQARFRGHRDRKSAGQEQSSPGSLSDRDQGSDRSHHDSTHEKSSSHPATHPSGKSNSDHHDHFKVNDHHETGEHHDNHHSGLKREPTQLSEDFERHTQVPRDADFQKESRPDLNNEEIDMNDPHLDKAATRIQASFRGYKTRKDLGTGGTAPDHHPTSTSSHGHDEYNHTHSKILSSSVEGNKEHDGEEDDNMAAVKIQAAYRGYRVRKDLEK